MKEDKHDQLEKIEKTKREEKLRKAEVRVAVGRGRGN
jgi:hypothetical protein